MTEQIIILDFGSQYTQVIARRLCASATCIRTILPYHYAGAETRAAQTKRTHFIRRSGQSVYADDAPLPDKAFSNFGIPVLGICYGEQLLAQFLGGRVEKGLKRGIWQRHAYGPGCRPVRCSDVCREPCRSGIRMVTS